MKYNLVKVVFEAIFQLLFSFPLFKYYMLTSIFDSWVK